MLSPKACKLAVHVVGRNSAIRSAVPEKTQTRTKHGVDRTTGCGDMAIWNFSKMAAAAIFDLFEPDIEPSGPPLLLAHYSLPYSCKAVLVIMDQMTHSRDRSIFIRNFPRWRAAANSENSTSVPNMWTGHYWLFSSVPVRSCYFTSCLETV